MDITLRAKSTKIKGDLAITGSKSESNRLLLLKALYPQLQISNLSNSDDSIAMENGLKIYQGEVDIHHAGTAMRFLTAFFASQADREVVLTGSHRMKERPIQILVDALRQLGAEISYTQNEGFPPIKISGKNLLKNKVALAANISSQYISALLLVAPKLPNGLEMHLEGTITSVPYIKMTLGLLNELGIQTSFEGNFIKVYPLNSLLKNHLIVESDWSSASYFFSLLSLSEIGSTVTLTSYKQKSLQGDSILKSIYKDFGIDTIFEGQKLTLIKSKGIKMKSFSYDLSNAPDIAQTIAVSCFGLGIACHLTGLHTLKIKETDRLEALKTELTKLGATISVTSDSLTIKASTHFNQNVSIDTYNDHRMAMAFAPLALKIPLTINDAEVVSKSYPDFWTDLESLGFEIHQK